MTIEEYKKLVLDQLNARKQSFYATGAPRNGRIAANLIADILAIEIPAEINVGLPNPYDGTSEQAPGSDSASGDTSTTTPALLDAGASQ